MNTPYKPALVAFMDILGFEALIKKLDKQPQLQDSVYASLSKIHAIGKRLNDPRFPTVHDNLNVSVFSDCIAITCEMEEMGHLFWTCGHLQADLLFSGILVRGGITYGKIVHEGNLLYGEGLIDAYRLESKAAIYPRIVFHPSLLGSLAPVWKSDFMRTDQDGFLAIDPFKFDAGHPYHPSLEEDGWCPRYLYFLEVTKRIKEGFSDAFTPDQKAKWLWLEPSFNEAITKYNKESNSDLDILQIGDA